MSDFLHQWIANHSAWLLQYAPSARYAVTVCQPIPPIFF